MMIEIRVLDKLTMDDKMSLGRDGYISNEKYIAEKTESEMQTVISLRLVPLEKPYEKYWDLDLTEVEDEIKQHQTRLACGLSYGAFESGKLVGMAVTEPREWNKTLWIWDVQVSDRHRRQGIGNALLDRACSAAKEHGYRAVGLEVQNTNMPAIKLYRKFGFTIEAVDLSFYTNTDISDGEIAIFMRYKF